ncbi:NAD(P)-dependent oxidoreductase [Candidatus Daviesbacteria bacterium]|nr:NAD(P)-dependent oxidoreductase [Candidatus Daviesbacteria bacterium]
MAKNDRVLILGGAGFIGSNIAKKFVSQNYKVTIIDGFLPQTGANLKNLRSILNKVKLIRKKVEKIDNLEKQVADNNLIIDSMGWTRHISGMENPLYDLELNLLSHISLINALRKLPGVKVIYLGSEGQYEPFDVQGINKQAAETYFKSFSKIYGFSTLSLRISHCFGQNQPTKDTDIGLVGLFIRNLLTHRLIRVFDKGRKRNFIYVEDLTEIIFLLSKREFSGFSSLDVNAYSIVLEELAQKLIRIVGFGEYKKEVLPKNLVVNDNYHSLDTVELKKMIGQFPKHQFDKALIATVNYFKENL